MRKGPERSPQILFTLVDPQPRGYSSWPMIKKSPATWIISFISISVSLNDRVHRQHT